MRIWLSVIAILVIGLILGWGSDAVTLQGERTVYTLQCVDGQWQGDSCGGHVAPGNRYRFRVLKAHEEVVFWTAGASGPSGKFVDCKIEDGRNWICPPGTQVSGTITTEIRRGVPVVDVSGKAQAFHAVSKWRWYLVKWGLPIGHSADN